MYVRTRIWAGVLYPPSNRQLRLIFKQFSIPEHRFHRINNCKSTQMFHQILSIVTAFGFVAAAAPNVVVTRSVFDPSAVLSGPSPSAPTSLAVVIVNNASTSLALRSSLLGKGSAWRSPLPTSIAPYGVGYNYGFIAIPTTPGGAINATVEYAAASDDDEAASPPYAVIHLFFKDPAWPAGSFGCEVNSNAHDDSIVVYQGLFDTSLGTAATFFIHINPPQ